MTRHRHAWIALVAALSLSAPAPAGAAEEPETWHSRAISEGPTGLTVTYFWSKGRSMRAQTVVQGRPIVTLVHRDWYYVVDEISGTGLAVERSRRALEEDASGERPFAMEAQLIVEQGGELVRTEKQGAEAVAVYRLSDRQGRREVWTPADGPRIPLRVEIFDRGTSAKRAVQYTSWDRTLVPPERFFRPDARIRLQRLTYDEYLQKTANAPPVLPVLYGALLHGRHRDGT